METHLVQEYRKQSAEKLGRIDKWTYEDHFTIDGKLSIPFNQWNPLKNANQREMIEDWLIEQGCRIIYEYKMRDKKWKVDIYSTFADGVVLNESKSVAFMKAFMEYITNK